MNNIHDWTISRQLWWGHRIPVWHCADCKEMIVARETPTKCKCGSGKLEQDADVLDTWFSSGLLPFTSLGWPEATPDLDVFYPTSLLITGFDILFFWVARMIMLGCWFMSPPHKPLRDGEAPKSGEEALKASVPFREVYIHALVRDADRQKMSKTKGNVLDPIEVIGKYGTDATRFTLASMSSPGTDIAFNPSRTEGYRAFANKIWNAARFMFMNVDRVEPGLRPAGNLTSFATKTLEDRWILSRFNRIAGEVKKSLEIYRFDEAARAIYDFFWGEFCDWYLELIKPRIDVERGASPEDARVVCENLVNLFESSLRLLHPVMPFITEEIWHAMYEGKPPLKSIALASYPEANEKQFDLAAETEMAILQDLIVSVRNLRAELKVEVKQKTPVSIYVQDSLIRRLIEQNRGALERLANVETIEFAAQLLSNLANVRSTARFDVRLVYEKKIDVAAERERLTKELDRIEKEIGNGQRQLGNEQFLAKAPPQVVEGIRNRMQELDTLQQKTRSQFDALK
jgi:valyl-tRNA synthetase